MKKVLMYVWLLMLCAPLANAQKSSDPITPDGRFDEVADRFGNRYTMQDLMIDTGTYVVNGVQMKNQLLCNSSGYFNLWFETGSGFEQNTPAHQARRNVLCQLFSDMSAFITPANVNNKVDIWIRNISNIPGVPGNALGLATSFYTMPAGAPAVTGITDGEVWRTINSGNNSYTNVVSPLLTQGGQFQSGNGLFYHGMMAFNFTNFNWHTDLTQTTAANTYDLYSVSLHELTHALGFASLIDANGSSRLSPAGFNYYSRYDLYLQTQGPPIRRLITNTGGCSLYNYTFNPLLNATNVLSPFPSSCPANSTTCSTAVKFGGILSPPQSVYTPNCYESGSSLSHLEDVCHLPNAYPNDQYYAMSNANGTGSAFMKRFLKSEERQVLCQIGYRVNSTYGSTANLTFFNYNSGQCPGLWVAGTNDGITTNGAYMWTTTSGGTVQISGATILANDFNANVFQCLQDVYNGPGTLSTTAGTGATTITYTAPANFVGTTVLRYIPYNVSTGLRGNITYILVRVNSGNCVASPCQLTTNGGFETGLNCGQMSPPHNIQINCWTEQKGSPDYYVRNCIPTSNFNITVPTGPQVNNTPVDTWNGAPNNRFIGLWRFVNSTSSGTEAMQTQLSAPIQGGTAYSLRFWARAVTGFLSGNAVPTVTFRGSTNQLAYVGPFGPFNFGQFFTSATVPNDNQWHFYNLTVNYPLNGPALNFLMVGNTSIANSYVLIDDISLVPSVNAITFNIPTPINNLCAGATLSDLGQFVSVPGGVFAGPGVTLASGIYSFSASIPGTYNIVYTVVTNAGCTLSVPAQVTVFAGTPPNVTISVSPNDTICVGQTVTFTATGANSYTWAPGINCTTLSCNSGTATPAVSTTYTVTGTAANGCVNTASVAITVLGSRCCQAANITIVNNKTSSAIGPIASGQIVDVLGNFIIDQFPASYNNVIFRMQPGARFTVNNNAHLELKRCQLFSCTDMWDGIYLIQNGTDAGDISVLNSTSVEDAINGIVANANGSGFVSIIDLQESSFNKNRNSLQIINAVTGQYPLTLRSNRFTCASSVNSPGNLLKAPFSTSISNAGIIIDRVTDKIIIGDDAQATYTNTFDNLTYGVFILRSGVTVHNNIFSNMKGSIPLCNQPPQLCPPPTGVAIYNSDLTPSNMYLTTGGAGVNQPNIFSDVFRAIEAGNIGYFTATGNKFTCSFTPAFFSPNIPTIAQYGIKLYHISGRVYIGLNSFTNFAFTTELRRNYNNTTSWNPAVQIHKNTIGTQTNGYVRRAIVLFDIGNTNTTPATIEVLDNDLNDILDFGIQCLNIHNRPVIAGTSPQSQSVFMRYSNTGQHYGIYVQSCDSAQVINNEVYSAGSANAGMRGIYIRQSKSNRVKCNSIFRIGTCFTAFGDCSSPYTAPSYSCGIIGNKFANAGIGIRLENGGRIGVQGNSTHPSANSWAGTAASYTLGQTRCDNNSLPVFSPLFCSTSSGASWPTNHQPANGPHYINFVTILPASNNIIMACGALSNDDDGNGKADPAGRSAWNEEPDNFSDMGDAYAPVQLDAYPNPGTGKFNLKVSRPLPDVTVEIFNSVGVLCYKGHFAQLDETSLDISNEKDGLYLIQITSDELQQTLKVLKMH